MQKLGFPGMRSFDKLKTISGAPKAFSFSPRPSDSISSGSFANLKLTAEKLVKEQASVKTDLEMANTKLKKSMEHIRVLEEKLQNAFNENAKLKVKQKEDEKLWRGLESKFSSTKTLCDQLTETLQHLASQVLDAERDKEFFEGKLSASSEVVDCLNQQMHGLSLKLDSAEKVIRNRENELENLKTVREEREKFYRDENCRAVNLIEEKDSLIKKFEEKVAENRLVIESLNFKLKELQLEFRCKEDEVKHLIDTRENLEKEKRVIQLSGDELAEKLVLSHQETKKLESFVNVLSMQLTVLDKESLRFIDKLDQLNILYGSCFKLFEQERKLSAELAQKLFNQLHDKFSCLKSEKDALQMVNQHLNNTVLELQKTKDAVMEQFLEESRSTGERIQTLEAEAESLLSKKTEAEVLVSNLQEKIETLSKSSESSEYKMQDLLLKISELQLESRENSERVHEEIQKKAEEIDVLHKESERNQGQVECLEKQLVELQTVIEEKEQCVLQFKENEKKLEKKITENQASLTAAESKLAEAKKLYDLMLASKHLELSKHLKEISHKNDQAINDIRRKYEVEKLEIVNMEKEKAEKVVGEMVQTCDRRLAECLEESRKQLMGIREEHEALITRIQEEHVRKEVILKADHNEELKRVQLQAELELREKITSLRNEHEAQMKALRCQHEDESMKLQEELTLQKSKEDRQRALLQLQWKVMSDRPQEEQEVNSKKEYSMSSIKLRDSGPGKRNQCTIARPENLEKITGSPLVGVTQTPVSKLLKKVKNPNTESVLSRSKHHKKVTRHEYEVETTNGRTITKRRKTKSTVMFEDPRKHKNINTPKANTPRSVVKEVKVVPRTRSSNIGDLFTEGSLNPYADDPYAFD